MKRGYPTNTEFRFFRPETLRALEPSAPGRLPTIEGYAAVFSQLSQDLGGFREYIAPGAFSQTIDDGDVRALIDHDQSLVLGRAKAGTLRMIQDEIGLRVEIDPSDTSFARDLLVNIRDRNIDGMSFGFITVSDNWSMQDGMPIRELRKCHLLDVSVVTFPAYTQTSVGIRSDDPATKSLAEYRCRCAAQLPPKPSIRTRLDVELYEALYAKPIRRGHLVRSHTP